MQETGGDGIDLAKGGPHKVALHLGRENFWRADAAGARVAVREWLVHCGDKF
jgi:hypothetical protein